MSEYRAMNVFFVVGVLASLGMSGAALYQQRKAAADLAELSWWAAKQKNQATGDLSNIEARIKKLEDVNSEAWLTSLSRETDKSLGVLSMDVQTLKERSEREDRDMERRFGRICEASGGKVCVYP